MSSSVLLFSSHNVTEEELADIILQSGGIVTTSPTARAFGGLVDGECDIWIDRIPCYDGVFDDEGNPLKEENIVLLEKAKGLLGGEFQTWLHIELGHGFGSEQLAVRFAYACCQLWPCVVDNNEGLLFTCKEIEKLYKENGVFFNYWIRRRGGEGI
ncbi:hypothetical protein KSC_032250 [Ktedonobacter sp. SOSP1-52]|uniref:hypothetical protein n=1 Tax=Ktedonobacter sp. SOSP1-52 TaxID=2778366 RepID=UPI001914FC53|nr:hypothetical protein [Ktedonobacter sp. SOSP1-52]GHO64333.1 hypothetical protein KSC_032250 [Ktedonobacter sp. SOSP1-52]